MAYERISFHANTAAGDKTYGTISSLNPLKNSIGMSVI